MFDEECACPGLEVRVLAYSLGELREQLLVDAFGLAVVLGTGIVQETHYA